MSAPGRPSTRARPAPTVLVWALGVVSAFVQLVGTNRAAHFRAHQFHPAGTGGHEISPAGYALLLVGPASILLLRRWRFAPLAVSIVAAVAYLGLGQPVGPIFAAPVAALVLEVVSSRRERLAAARREAQLDRDRTAVEQRVAIARDLHDVLGHSLSLINVQAGIALHLLEEHPDNVRPALQTIKTASHDALEEVRTVLDSLRDPGAASRTPAPTLLDLPALVEQSQPGPVAWSLTVTGARGAVPAAVDTAAYRVVMEAMTNVRRHSGATRARVQVTYAVGQLRVRVTDNGAGARGEKNADVDGPAQGSGLVSLRERVATLGGLMRSGDRDAGGGFVVEARLPLPAGPSTSESGLPDETTPGPTQTPPEAS